MQQDSSQLVGVYGFILNKNNKILIVQRSPHDSHPGTWEMPGGGLEYGEDPINGTKREVFEETGLDVTIHYPLGTTTGYSKNKHIIRVAYLCKLTTADQSVQLSSEHSAHKWIQLDEKINGKLSNLLAEVLNTVKKHPHLLKNE